MIEYNDSTPVIHVNTLMNTDYKYKDIRNLVKERTRQLGPGLVITWMLTVVAFCTYFLNWVQSPMETILMAVGSSLYLTLTTIYTLILFTELKDIEKESKGVSSDKTDLRITKLLQSCEFQDFVQFIQTGISLAILGLHVTGEEARHMYVAQVMIFGILPILSFSAFVLRKNK